MQPGALAGGLLRVEGWLAIVPRFRNGTHLPHETSFRKRVLCIGRCSPISRLRISDSRVSAFQNWSFGTREAGAGKRANEGERGRGTLGNGNVSYVPAVPFFGVTSDFPTRVASCSITSREAFRSPTSCASPRSSQRSSTVTLPFTTPRIMTELVLISP